MRRFLHYVVDKSLAGNFDADDSNAVCIIGLLSLLDEYLERVGAIRSDMAAILCRAKK